MNITFAPLTESHFPILLNWLESPHVKEHWDQDIVYTLELVKENFGEHAHANPISNKQDKLTYAYIIKADDEAIGYIQAYNAKAHASDNDIDIGFIEGQVCGIDLFIGNKQFLHKGLGAMIIEEFCRQLLVEQFDKCLIDPEANNDIAIRSFQKAGFKTVPQLQTEKTAWMIKELKTHKFHRGKITIDLLKNHPNAIPRLAHIWHDLIGSIWAPDIMIPEVEAWMHEWHNQDTLPLALIAVSEDIPVGSCSLQVNDGIRPDLSPWLGDLCVDPNHQNQGIGRLLIDATKNKAKSLGFKKLYLFAFDPTIPDYYESLGWSKIGMDEYKGHPVTVMEISL